MISNLFFCKELKLRCVEHRVCYMYASYAWLSIPISNFTALLKLLPKIDLLLKFEKTSWSLNRTCRRINVSIEINQINLTEPFWEDLARIDRSMFNRLCDILPCKVSVFIFTKADHIYSPLLAIYRRTNFWCLTAWKNITIKIILTFSFLISQYYLREMWYFMHNELEPWYQVHILFRDMNLRTLLLLYLFPE